MGLYMGLLHSIISRILGENQPELLSAEKVCQPATNAKIFRLAVLSTRLI
jgi:hypothetical protein